MLDLFCTKIKLGTKRKYAKQTKNAAGFITRHQTGTQLGGLVQR